MGLNENVDEDNVNYYDDDDNDNYIIIIINGDLMLSFHRNIEIRDTDSLETRQITSLLLSSYNCRLFLLHSPHQCRSTDCHRFSPVIWKMTGGTGVLQ
jgi:hypothetical protein